MLVKNKNNGKTEEVNNVFIIDDQLKIIFDGIEYDASKQYELIR